MLSRLLGVELTLQISIVVSPSSIVPIQSSLIFLCNITVVLLSN